MSIKYSQLSEQELIRLCKQGDRRAFDVLIKEHEKFMYNVAARYTDFKEDTDEVVQESMMKIWLNIDNFRGDSKLTTWAYVITANAAKKNLTSRSKVPSHPWNQKLSYEETMGIDHKSDMEEDFGFVDHTDDHRVYGIDSENPESLYMSEKLGEAIFTLFEQLDDDLFNALYLREIELKSYEEISEELDIPLGTCKSRLFNARSMLDMSLKRYLGLDSNQRFQPSL